MSKIVDELQKATAELKEFNDTHIPANITMTVHALIEESHDSKDVDVIYNYFVKHYNLMSLSFREIMDIVVSLYPLLNFINNRISECIANNEKGCFTYNISNLVSFEMYSTTNLEYEPTDEEMTNHTLQLKEEDFKAIKFFLKKANTELNEQYLYLRYVWNDRQWKTSYGNH